MGTRLAVLALILTLAACAGATTRARYVAGDPDAPARAGWRFDEGGLPHGVAISSGTWTARAEAGAPSAPNALCQTGTATFPTLTLSETIYADVTIATQFKPIAGREDRAAGLIARVQDRDNYYTLRANALENNVNLYKYVGGKRDVIKEGRATVPSGRWQELRLVVAGNRLQGYLDGQLAVEATDDTFSAGKVGLWTKADSQTCFDDVEVRRP